MYNNYNIREELKPEEIIMYLRKSRADGTLFTVEEVVSEHEKRLDEWCDRNLSGRIPHENRFKEIVSGGENIDDRPLFQHVLKLIESPKYKAVIVKDVARLGRPDTMEIGRISKTFRFTNTLVITPEKIFNIADNFERDMFENELKRSQYYLDYTKGILRIGRDNSAKSGNFIGKTPPYGYNKTSVIVDKKKCPTLEINEEQANIVRMIFDSYVKENIGTQVIANRLNEMNLKSPRGKIWTPDAIRTILENVHYIGKIRWNARKGMVIVDNGEFRKTRPLNKGDDFIIVEGKHEPIISEELFNAAQAKRGRTHRATANKELKNPFASLIFCKCGKAMSHRLRKYPSGKNRGEARLVCNGQILCGTGSCTMSEIEDFVADLLKQKIAEFEVAVNNTEDESIKLHDKLIAQLEKTKYDIDAREMEMWKSQVDPDPEKRIPPDIFKKLRADLLVEREENKQALEQAYNSRPTPIDYEQKRITFQNALDALLDDNKSAAEKNQLLKACIDRIEYHRDKPEKVTGKGVGHQWTQPPIELEVKLHV